MTQYRYKLQDNAASHTVVGSGAQPNATASVNTSTLSVSSGLSVAGYSRAFQNAGSIPIQAVRWYDDGGSGTLAFRTKYIGGLGASAICGDASGNSGLAMSYNGTSYTFGAEDDGGDSPGFNASLDGANLHHYVMSILNGVGTLIVDGVQVETGADFSGDQFIVSALCDNGSDNGHGPLTGQLLDFVIEPGVAWTLAQAQAEFLLACDILSDLNTYYAFKETSGLAANNSGSDVGEEADWALEPTYSVNGASSIGGNNLTPNFDLGPPRTLVFRVKTLATVDGAGIFTDTGDNAVAFQEDGTVTFQNANDFFTTLTNLRSGLPTTYNDGVFHDIAFIDDGDTYLPYVDANAFTRLTFSDGEEYQGQNCLLLQSADTAITCRFILGYTRALSGHDIAAIRLTASGPVLPSSGPPKQNRLGLPRLGIGL